MNTVKRSGDKPAGSRPPDAEIIAEIRAFLGARKLLHLASLTREGLPYASSAPFLAADGNFYLLLSGLSQHTANLRTNCHASAIFTADESETAQPFACRRATFAVKARSIERTQAQWQLRATQLRRKFGPIIDQLNALGDFHLFERPRAAGVI